MLQATDTFLEYYHATNREPTDLERCIGIMDSALREEDRLQNTDDGRTRHLEWEGLIEPHLEVAFRLAYLTLGNEDDARDAVQDALIRAWRSFGQFDRGLPIRPWWLRIVVNTARNHRRSAGRYWATLTRSAALDSESGPSPEVDYSKGNRTARLWSAARNLPYRDQELLYLRFFMEMSLAECATVLRVAEGTVKSRTHRALKKLEEIIVRDYPDLEEDWRNEQ